MIRKIVLTVIAILLFTTASMSNPYLISEPSDNETDWYTFKLNDNDQVTVSTDELKDWDFFFSIDGLEQGINTIILQACNPHGDSKEVKFFVLMEIFDTYRRYEIKSDPENNDPEYLENFQDNLVVEITDGDVIPPIQPPEESSGGGGGGGGCFISTIQ
jgi:hypothetical protein